MNETFRGITCPEDARIRCRVTDSGCWVWIAATNSSNTPQAWFPTLKSTTSVRAGLWRLENSSKTFPKDRALVPTCGDPKCVNPRHTMLRTRSYITKNGAPKPPTHRLRVAMTRRSQSKLKPEDIELIRSGTETLDVLAARFGVSSSQIHRIRNGTAWKSLVIASSIFAIA